jgi:hypothetical protein
MGIKGNDVGIREKNVFGQRTYRLSPFFVSHSAQWSTDYSYFLLTNMPRVQPVKDELGIPTRRDGVES